MPGFRLPGMTCPVRGGEQPLGREEAGNEHPCVVLFDSGVLLGAGADLPVSFGYYVGASDDHVRAEIPQVRVDGQPGDHDRIDVGGIPVHRAGIGALGAQLLGAFKALIENPMLMLV